MTEQNNHAVLAVIEMVGGALISEQVEPAKLGEIFKRLSQDEEVVKKFEEFLTVYNDKFNQKLKEVLGKEDVKSLIVIFPYAVPEKDSEYVSWVKEYFDNLSTALGQEN